MFAPVLAVAFALIPILGGATSLTVRETCDSGTGTLLCCDLLASVSCYSIPSYTLVP